MGQKPHDGGGKGTSDVLGLQGLFQALTEQSQTAIFVHRGGILLYANPQLAGMIGISPQAVIGKPILDYVHPEDRNGVRENYEQRLAGKDVPQRYEIRLLRHDGEAIWVDLMVTSFEYEGGRVAMGNMVDITESKRLAEQLSDSRARYKTLYNEAPVGLFRTRVADGKVVDVNDHVLRMFGFGSRKELDDLQTAQSFYADPGRRKAMLNVLKSAGRVRDFEVQFRRKSGTKFWVRVNAHLTPARDFVEGSVTDITEMKHANQALRESEEMIRMLLRSLDDLIFLQDNDGVYLYTNFGKQYGIRDEDVIGRGPKDILPEDSAAHIVQRVQQVFETGEGMSAENRIVWQDEELWFYDRLSPVRGRNGEVRAVVTISRNITDRKRAEKERQTLEEQLLLAQKMEAIGRLAGGIAHDFNNLLTGIIGNLEMAGRYATGDSMPFLEGAGKAAHRAADLVRQILTFSRRSRPVRRAIDPRKIVSETVELLRETIDRRIQVNVAFRDGAGDIHADTGQFQQVAMNLLINARDAIGDMLDAAGDGERTVHAEPFRIDVSLQGREIDAAYCRIRSQARPGTYVALTVRDNGPGIPLDVQDRIFEPFFTTKETGQGTGLGLATLFGIVQQHDGWVTVESEPGRGAKFEVFFPRAVAGRKDEDEAVGILQPLHGTETVLLVDDEDMICDLGKAILERYGYTVLIARDGGAGIETFVRNRERIGLVILDLTLPVMSGWEVLEQIRLVDPKMKVLLSSGYHVASTHPQVDGDRLVDFADKPYKVNDLAAKVRELLDR